MPGSSSYTGVDLAVLKKHYSVAEHLKNSVRGSGSVFCDFVAVLVDNEFNDMTVLIGNELIHVNRPLFTARLPNDKSSQILELEEKNTYRLSKLGSELFDKKTFRSFLQYLYTGSAFFGDRTLDKLFQIGR